jgi:hypothetical protein
MANSFWEGEKASREDARKSLMNFIADNWEGRFTVNFHSDDGGHLIQAVFEVDDPDEKLPGDVREKFGAKWMGWRLVLLKVTPGYIDVFIKK